jgi:hypothetical protein
LLSNLKDELADELGRLSHHHLTAEEHGPERFKVVNDLFGEELREVLVRLNMDKQEEYEKLVSEFPEAEEIRELPDPMDSGSKWAVRRQEKGGSEDWLTDVLQI